MRTILKPQHNWKQPSAKGRPTKASRGSLRYHPWPEQLTDLVILKSET
jgi:hypothetical protein